MKSTKGANKYDRWLIANPGLLVESKNDITNLLPAHKRGQIDRLAYPVAEIASGVVLELFAQPLVFGRVFVEIAGSVSAGLMLSHAVEISRSLDVESDGWFACNDDDWFESACLSKSELAAATEQLKSKQFLCLTTRHLNDRTEQFYWVNNKAVWAAITAHSDAKWNQAGCRSKAKYK
jgi:hypothetical protein